MARRLGHEPHPDVYLLAVSGLLFQVPPDSIVHMTFFIILGVVFGSTLGWVPMPYG